MRFATSLVSVCFVALALGPQSPSIGAPASASPPGGSLSNLLAKARAASGEPYKYHIVSFSHETHDGTTFDVTTESQGEKYVAKSCAHSLCTGFYFDGEHSYNTNFNDTPLPATAGADGLQITLRAIASYAFAATDFVANGGTLVERDPVLRDGKKYRRISVAPRLGDLLDAILDPSTGLVVGVISDERKYAFEFSDQRRIARGITLPFAISLNGFTFTKYERRAIATSGLSAPSGVVPTFADRAAPVAMIASDKGAAPILPCSIGGENVSCLLDTGDSGLSLSLELARKLHLKALGGAFDVHGSGRYVAGIAAAPSLSIGNATYPAASYVVLSGLAHNGYDVILGADAFAHARVTVDYAKREVEIASVSPSSTGGEPMTFENFVPVVPIVLDGKAVTVQLATGDDGAILISRDYARSHPDVTNGRPTGTIASVRLGPVVLENQPFDARETIAYSARLGSDVLRHCAVTFDYARSAVLFAPQQSALERKVAPEVGLARMSSKTRSL